LETQAVQALAQSALEDLKAQDLVDLDISIMSSIADHMLVATATSNRHARSMADEVSKRAKAEGLFLRMEGEEQGEWILIDLGSVIVHVMQSTARKLYDLESLWKLAPPGELEKE
jgi:ribosome-associated protein